MEKGYLRYECECTEMNACHDCFFPVVIQGKEYILFRKALYGFILADTETLTEEFSYFPAAVLNGGESYIITHAESFRDLIIFDGCWWGAPYMYYVCDPLLMRFADLTTSLGVFSEDHGIRIENGLLTLHGEDEQGQPVSVTLTEDRLRRILREKGTETL